MSSDSVQLIVASFETEVAMRAAWKRIEQEKTAVVHGAVGLHKDEEGSLHHKDLGMTPGKGAAAGLVLGAALGVVTGGATVALGALGSLIGTVVGRRQGDKHIPVELYNWEAASLKPGESAILIVADPASADRLYHDLGTRGEILTGELSPELLDKLAHHEATAFEVLSDVMQKPTSDTN